MIALGFGIIWIGYSLSFTGYCWVRGYDLAFKQIVFPVGFYTGQWPPPQINDPTALVPSGTSGSGGSSGPSGPGPSGTAGTSASNPTGTVAGGHGR